MQLCRDQLVRTIKEVQKINTTKNCDRLRRGIPEYVVPTSYIVMIKPHNNMSELVSDTALYVLKQLSVTYVYIRI